MGRGFNSASMKLYALIEQPPELATGGLLSGGVTDAER